MIQSGIGMPMMPDDKAVGSLFRDLKAFTFPHLFDSVYSDTKVDIGNPMVWNDIPLPQEDDDDDDDCDDPTSPRKQKQQQRSIKPSLMDRFRLKLPDKQDEMDYINHHFHSQMNLLRITNMIGIFAICYDGFQNGLNTYVALIPVRILCFAMLLFSITLSFLKNKSYYQRSYVPLFLLSFTIFFLTFVLEFIQTFQTLILFLYGILLISLYAVGCLMFQWLLLFNVILILIFMVSLGVVQPLTSSHMISYSMYIFFLLLMGCSHLYVLEKYRKQSFVFSKELQKKAERLKLEKARSDELLSNILPDFVIKMIRELPVRSPVLGSDGQFPPLISKDFQDCTLLYCDIVEFTSLASRLEPSTLVRLLNEVFTEFDRIVEEFKCEKIKTDGDAYLCAGGLTVENEQHLQAIMDVAMSILKSNILRNNCLNAPIKIRVGVASGSVIGGVIGCEKFQFDVWGEAIAKAHTLEESGQPGKIHILKCDLDKLRNINDYIIEENPQAPLKEQSYFLTPSTELLMLGSSNNNINNQQHIHSNNQQQQQQNVQDGNYHHVISFGEVSELNQSTASLQLQKNHATTTTEQPRSISMLSTYWQRAKKAIYAEVWPKSVENAGLHGASLGDVEMGDTSSKELADVDSQFSEYTRINKWLVQFENMAVERNFHRYVINSTILETRFFLFIGMMLHVIFYFDDYLLQSEPVLNAKLVYLIMMIVFILFFATSLTPTFAKPILYHIFFILLLVMFCICTLLELIRLDNPLARSSVIRVCFTLFYANVFYSLNFIFVMLLNIFILVCFFILSVFVSGTILEHLYPTDYLGIILVLVIQICASYLMKLGMRKAWITKSKIKFKGLTLQKERERSANLLENILPKTISKQLMKGSGNKRGGRMMMIAHNYDNIAIMFINIVGFEQMMIPSGGTTLLYYMNYIFTLFDGLSAKYELEKIKTIGTTYMVVAGLKKRTEGQSERHHLANMANMALMAKACVKHLNAGLNVQVGMSYGCCVAGCIGNRSKFDVWGDTTNVASRMQSSAPSGKIQVTSEIGSLLSPEFFIEERGIITVKGKGEMNTYYITGRKQSDQDLQVAPTPTLVSSNPYTCTITARNVWEVFGCERSCRL
ncbi:hypothetical protein SAMD00019534_048360 [Acytostelium subglobosum LB1]|uniref:hypothetical protein n=1 Tax=Acytostelium subglobosum LB1 TaxID=1410327 RepID=UPI00064489B2|nr:hypothetical protein SAMD00019534_048360 [Acytostelium subglobosum LB1]GAM21661.1 hypothetical protein SAMD00019534_048360 [Acytostelium subglobosum LB1]|eukprot:XP_012755780.1 hypothetical protein SAMD00019534_048360 [Acytostelium subglobosum LB1]